MSLNIKISFSRQTYFVKYILFVNQTVMVYRGWTLYIVKWNKGCTPQVKVNWIHQSSVSDELRMMLATTVAWLTVNSADTRIKQIPLDDQSKVCNTFWLVGLDKYLKDWLNLLETCGICKGQLCMTEGLVSYVSKEIKVQQDCKTFWKLKHLSDWSDN